MPEVNGIDTIFNISEAPMEITLDRKIIENQQRLMKAWNYNYIAIIPYCFVCKEPLIWHEEPRENNTRFHCPKCKRKWIVEGRND